MIKIVLEENQNGYNEVFKYIKRFLDKRNTFGMVVFTIALSYDDEKYFKNTELVDVDYDKVIYDNDWWEGEKYIKLYGITLLDDLYIEGGIYNE